MTHRSSLQSFLQSFGVKLFLLGGTLGCLVVADLLPNPSQSPHFGESAIRQTDADPLVERPDNVPDNAAANVQVDLNQSSVEELQALPGIGPVLAERIRQYRRDKGNFTSIEEITKVRGIGAKRFARLRPYIAVRRQGVSPNG